MTVRKILSNVDSPKLHILKTVNATNQIIKKVPAKRILTSGKDVYRPKVSKAFSELIKASKNGERKLTKRDLLDEDLTDVLRAASKCCYLREKVKKLLDYNPLPIKQYLQYDRIKYDPMGRKIYYTEYKKIRLFPHQIKAIQFMKEREDLVNNGKDHHGIRGCLVSLEMGLGKSLIAIILSLIAEKPFGTLYPTLIIASKTVMGEWELEGFEKFFGKNLKVLYFHKDYLGKRFDSISRDDILEYDFVVTTYEVVKQAGKKYADECLIYGETGLHKNKVIGMRRRHRHQSDDPNATGLGILYRTPWRRIFADECHNFANPATVSFRCMATLYADFYYGLTGTAVRNYDTDIWAQLYFLGYNGVNNAKEWSRRSYLLMRDHQLRDAILNMKISDTTIVIPPVRYKTVDVQLSKEERDCYNVIRGAARQAYNDMMAGLINFASVLAMLTRLRQAAIAPYLMTDESKRNKGKYDKKREDKALALERLKREMPNSMGTWVHDKYGAAGIYSSKITSIINSIQKVPEGDKILVFSMFTSALDLISDAISERLPDVGFIQMDGDDKGNERREILYKFKNDPNIKILLMTYKVGSEGLNLTEACWILNVEKWWSPAVQQQAKSRAVRPGQEKEVTVVDYIIRDSVEERIMEICESKEALSQRFLGESTTTVKQQLNVATLGRILGIR